jgi:hypothetical protein
MMKSQSILAVPFGLSLVILLTMGLTRAAAMPAQMMGFPAPSKLEVSAAPHILVQSNAVVGPRIPICEEPREEGSPATAYNQQVGNYLVVWHSNFGSGDTRLQSRLVYPDGALSAINTLTTGNTDSSPKIAYNSQRNEYLMVFNREVSSYVPVNYDVYGLRLDAQGLPIDVPFGINVDSDAQYSARVVYNSHDDEYLVVYQNKWFDGVEDIDARRISGEGVPLPPDSGVNVITGAIPHREPDVAYNPVQNNYFIIYTHEASPTSIRFKVAPANLAGLSSSPDAELCPTGKNQDEPVVSIGEDEFMAIWREMQDPGNPSNPDIRARRINGMGIPLGDEAGFDVGALTHDDGVYGPRIASGRRFAYLVVWVRDATGLPYSENVEGRFIPLYQDHPSSSELSIDVSENGQTEVAITCAPSGDCLVVSARAGNAWDISGRLVSPLRVYLPLALRQ